MCRSEEDLFCVERQPGRVNCEEVWVPIAQVKSRSGEFRTQTPGEDPTSSTPNSGFEYSYGMGYRTLRRIYFLDPPRGLGSLGLVHNV